MEVGTPAAVALPLQERGGDLEKRWKETPKC